ncbi:MAG: hypothetical protein ACI9KE_002478 [Polyangiales bacterium]|jgi:hypothetical protein
MKRVVAIFVVIFASLSVPADAQQVGTLFEEANESFYAGDYASAIQNYEELCAAGVVDGDLSYNLGTAYAKEGLLGQALLNFERSLYLDPGASDAQTNLAATQQALAERLTATRGEIETSESRGLGEAIVRGISEFTLGLLLLICWALVFLMLIARMYSKGRARVGTTITSVVAFVFVGVFAALLASKHGMFREGEPAVVTASVDLLEGPDPRATTRGEAFEGERGSLVAEDGDYVRVSLDASRGGWLLREHVGLVRE